jgi:selT/selW/selH-like putative selenoprotein
MNAGGAPCYHQGRPVDIQPGRTGQFDVVVDGQVAFSRYETGRFPSEADLANVPV